MAHKNPLSWYLVSSPEVGYCEDFTLGGPWEYERCVLYVEAHTKREARLRAVKAWRAQDAAYLADVENPFAGVIIEPAPWLTDENIADERPEDLVRYTQ